MSQVCKSLRDSIRDDVLVWLNLVVEKPLSRRLTDRILMNITSKAHGRLRTLALLNCFKITDDGLLKVVIANPLLTKVTLITFIGFCFFNKLFHLTSTRHSLDEEKANDVDVI